MAKQLPWLKGGAHVSKGAYCNSMALDEKLFKPISKPNETEVGETGSIKITSNKRSTAGFHIYPEYEDAIKIISLYGRHRNKGKALEYLVEFYLSNLPQAKQRHLMRLIEGQEEIDHNLD